MLNTLALIWSVDGCHTIHDPINIIIMTTSVTPAMMDGTTTHRVQGHVYM